MDTIISIAIFVFIILGIVFYLQTFVSILNFKWYIDYFYSKDKACLKKNWTKFEIESYRYNLYIFLNNYDYNQSYANIYNSYKLYYGLFITQFFILLAGYLYILVNFSNTSLYSYMVWLLLIGIYIVYVIVNGVLLSKFERINNIKNDKNSALSTYHNTYRILNAIMYVSNLNDSIMEYTNKKLNDKRQDTFENIIDNNIASYENISNTSKVKQIKLIAYDNLDFLKYITFDRMSSFYMKYFDNIYIRLPEDATDQFDISENTYLSDIYIRRNNSVNYDTIKIEFDKIKNAIKDEQNNTYNSLFNYISNNYPSDNEYSKMLTYYEEINRKFNNDKKLEEYNKQLYYILKQNLLNINGILQNQNDTQIYTKVNKLIEKTLTDKNIIFDIDKKDYIKYFLDNKDILFDTDYDKDTRFKELSDEVNSYTNYIYAYFVYFILIFFGVSHYLFRSINSINYVYLMITFIILYFTYGYYRSYIVKQ